jgi:hypothetical protein
MCDLILTKFGLSLKRMTLSAEYRKSGSAEEETLLRGIEVLVRK